jgi:hypothetical protein
VATAKNEVVSSETSVLRHASGRIEQCIGLELFQVFVWETYVMNIYVYDIIEIDRTICSPHELFGFTIP